MNVLKLKNSNGIEENIIIEHIVNDKENYYYFKKKDNKIFRILQGTVELKEE